MQGARVPEGLWVGARVLRCPWVGPGCWGSGGGPCVGAGAWGSLHGCQGPVEAAPGQVLWPPPCPSPAPSCPCLCRSPSSAWRVTSCPSLGTTQLPGIASSTLAGPCTSCPRAWGRCLPQCHPSATRGPPCPEPSVSPGACCGQCPHSRGRCCGAGCGTCWRQPGQSLMRVCTPSCIAALARRWASVWGR